MSNVKDAKPARTSGGKIALWLFYGFCLYIVWAMLRYFWVVSRVTGGEMGSLGGKLLGALMGLLVLGSAAAVLGWVAWYTRPRGDLHRE
ncbi:cell division protein DrpB [Dryocola sp. BD613]|uniref:cell division protein DrpB n=1 Tax=Dryocola sp. BD613 TaxID=3133272 RepID=UPI003F50333E